MKGKVTQIIGPVVDIEFDGHVPAVYNAIEVKVGDKVVVLETQYHLSGNVVRAARVRGDRTRGVG